MRLTVGRKLSLILIINLVGGIVGALALLTNYYMSEMSSNFENGVRENLKNYVGRMTSDIKRYADRGLILAKASTRSFETAEEQKRFVLDNFDVDKKFLSLGLYGKLRENNNNTNTTSPFSTYKPAWRIVNQSIPDNLKFLNPIFENIDTAYPFNFLQTKGGGIDFQVTKTQEDFRLLRLAVPLDKLSSIIMLIELDHDKFFSLFSGTTYHTYLFDRNGIIIGSSSPQIYPVGLDLKATLSSHPAFSNSKTGQSRYDNHKNTTQIISYEKLSYGDLTMVSELSYDI